MPDRYDAVDEAFLEAAQGRYTVTDVARALGRTESAVYQAALRRGIKFKPKSGGSLTLTTRGAFVIPEDRLPECQRVINRIGNAFREVATKTAAFLKALELADCWLDDWEDTNDLGDEDCDRGDEENENDVARTRQPPPGKAGV